MPQLENKVSFEVDKALNRISLGEILNILEDAMVPLTADLQIIGWPNKEGFTVKATWTKNV